MKGQRLWIVLALLGLALSGCSASTVEPGGNELDMASPAAVYCEEQGGTIELRSDENGAYGVCIFPDGSECEEWAFFRGECSPGGEEAEEEDLAGVSMAREAALDYIFDQYGEGVFPAPGSNWTVERTSGEVLGWVEYRFTAGDVAVTVGHAVVPPEQMVYEVTVAETTTGFEWQGEVDAQGQVSEGQSRPLSAISRLSFRKIPALVLSFSI